MSASQPAALCHMLLHCTPPKWAGKSPSVGLQPKYVLSVCLCSLAWFDCAFLCTLIFCIELCTCLFQDCVMPLYCSHDTDSPVQYISHDSALCTLQHANKCPGLCAQPLWQSYMTSLLCRTCRMESTCECSCATVLSSTTTITITSWGHEPGDLSSVSACSVVWDGI